MLRKIGSLLALCALSFSSVSYAQGISGNPPLAGTGTVTSVGVTPPADLFTGGTAVTSSGNVSFTKNSQTANTIWAAPNGSAGAPVFRSLVSQDFPTTIASNTTGNAANITGIAAVANGGTNCSTASVTCLQNISGSQTAATVFAAPTGAAGVGTFRFLASTDLPSNVAYLNQSQTWTAGQTFNNPLQFNSVSTMAGNFNITASSTSGAHLNIASGPTPTTTTNGDIWNDNGTLRANFAGINSYFAFGNQIPRSGFSGLKISAIGVNNYSISVSANWVTVMAPAYSGAEQFYTAPNPNVTITANTVGASGLDTGSLVANTWYYVYLTCRSQAVGGCVGLISASATSPTLPSGFVSYTRLGCVLTDGSANKYLMNTSSSNYFKVAPSVNYAAQGDSLTNIQTNGVALNNPNATIEYMLEAQSVAVLTNSTSSGLRVLGWTDNL